MTITSTTANTPKTLLFSMYEGKSASQTVADYVKQYPHTGRARNAINTKEKQVRQKLYEKLHPPVDETDKTGKKQVISC